MLDNRAVCVPGDACVEGGGVCVTEEGVCVCVCVCVREDCVCES